MSNPWQARQHAQNTARGVKRYLAGVPVCRDCKTVKMIARMSYPEGAGQPGGPAWKMVKFRPQLCAGCYRKREAAGLPALDPVRAR